MKCPLCYSNAPYTGLEVDDDQVVEYRCHHGHLIQYLLTELLLTLLILGYDGDELYRLQFNAKHKLTKLEDWRWFPEDRWFSPTETDLEGTGTEVADDRNPDHDYEPHR